MTERDPFNQFTGAFDRPVAPAPDFAVRLRAQVLAELTDAQQLDAMAAGAGSVSHSANGVATERDKAMAMHASSNGQVIELRSAVPTVVPQRAHSRRRVHRLLRWLPALEVAAAILLMMTLFGQLIGPENVRNALIPDLFEPTRRLESPMIDGTTDAPIGLPPSSLSGPDPVEGLLVATPSPDTAPSGSPVASDERPSERSTAAGGSWTFDVAVPATSPGLPEVFPASDEGQLVLAADVAGETLVRLVAPGVDQIGSTSVEAVSLTSGERRWVVEVANANGPVIADGRVFVFGSSYLRAGTERSIVALDLESGRERWRAPFTGQWGEFFAAAPLVAGSTLYVGDALGVVYAFDVASGTLRWQSPGGVEPARSSYGSYGDLVAYPTFPVADDRHIYTQTADGVLHALDLETGESAWRVPILDTYVDGAYYVAAMADEGTIILDVFETPSFESMNVNATPADGHGDYTLKSVTVALDASTGRELWQRAGDADSEEGSGAELIGGDLVLGYGLDGNPDGLRPLVALRARDGTQLWQSDVIPTQSNWWTMTRAHVVAIVPGGTLVAIDLATGEEAWRAAMPPLEPAIPAIITEDKIIVVGYNGEVVVWRI